MNYEDILIRPVVSEKASMKGKHVARTEQICIHRSP